MTLELMVEIIVGLTLVMLTGSVLLYFIRLPIDASKVHPSISDIEGPVEIEARSYKDGGSKEIVIRTEHSDELSFWLPHPLGHPNLSGRFFFGHFQDGIEINEDQYPHTRRKLARWIEQYAEFRSGEFQTLPELARDPFALLRMLVCNFRFLLAEFIDLKLGK